MYSSSFVVLGYFFDCKFTVWCLNHRVGVFRARKHPRGTVLVLLWTNHLAVHWRWADWDRAWEQRRKFIWATWNLQEGCAVARSRLPTPSIYPDKSKGCGWQGSGSIHPPPTLITKVSLTVKCASAPGLETGLEEKETVLAGNRRRRGREKGVIWWECQQVGGTGQESRGTAAESGEWSLYTERCQPGADGRTGPRGWEPRWIKNNGQVTGKGTRV